MSTSTTRAIALLIAHPADASLLLAVQRPLDDADLPGVWGLPAATVRAHESDVDAARRLGVDKLGAAVTLGPLLAEGAQPRPGGELAMRLYSAVLHADAPSLPPRVPGVGVTLYAGWRWAAMSALAPGARAGSLCCALALATAPSALPAQELPR